MSNVEKNNDPITNLLLTKQPCLNNKNYFFITSCFLIIIYLTETTRTYIKVNIVWFNQFETTTYNLISLTDINIKCIKI